MQRSALSTERGGHPHREEGSDRPRRHVLLLRSMPEERKASMERFADELQRGFAPDAELRMTAMRVRTPRFADRAGLDGLGGYAARLVRYPLAVRGTSADVYHVCDHSYAHLAAFLPPSRTVITCHDVTPLVAAESPEVPGLSGRTTRMFRWRASYFAKVVCVSEATKRDVIRICGVPAERLAVVAPGVAPHFHPLDASERPLREPVAPSSYAIMHVSNGQAYKNVPATLEVLALLRRSGLDVTLHRVGPRLGTDEAERARTLGLEPSIVEHGRVSERSLVRLYDASDVLLFPSHYEGFGWPALEAMATGTPVVGSDCPALVELIGDAGLTRAAGDVEGLADATRMVLESEGLRADLRSRGLARASVYTWERALGRYRQVYEEAADGA